MESAAPWLLTLLALGLRLHRLGHEPLWFDEAYSALTAVRPVGDILALVKGEISAPLYYLVLHGWAAALGDTEFRLRLLSALVGTATIPLLYWIGARMFSPRAGLVAAALAALSPLHIHYSQEARMYAMMPPLALGVLSSLHRLLLAPTPWALAAFITCATVGLYLHYFFFLLLPLAGAALVVPARRRAILALAGALILVALGFLPWASAFLRQAASGTESWVAAWWQQRSLSYAVLWSLESFGPGAEYPVMANFKFPSIAAARAISLGLAALVLAGAVVQTWRERGQRPAGATSLALAAVLVPLILALGVSLARSPIYVVARYDLISWGAYYLLAGAVLSRLRVALAAPAVVLWVGLSVATLVPYYTTARARPNYASLGDEIAATLKTRAHAGELVIFTAGTRTMTEYYLRDVPDRPRLASYPLANDDHLGWIDIRVATDPQLAASEARRLTAWMAASTPAPDVVWIVAPKIPGNAPLIDELRRLGYRADAARSTRHVLCLTRT